MKTLLQKINTCESGQSLADSQTDYKTEWSTCEHGDLMLQVAARADIDLRVMIKARVECAKLVEHLMTDVRSINMLRVAERFAAGEATRDELDAAACAAYVVADAYAIAAADPDATHDTYATYAAAVAAYAYVSTATYAAAAASADAYVAALSADEYAAAAACSAHNKTLKQCADICREYINFDDVMTGLIRLTETSQ